MCARLFSAVNSFSFEPYRVLLRCSPWAALTNEGLDLCYETSGLLGILVWDRTASCDMALSNSNCQRRDVPIVSCSQVRRLGQICELETYLLCLSWHRHQFGVDLGCNLLLYTLWSAKLCFLHSILLSDLKQVKGKTVDFSTILVVKLAVNDCPCPVHWVLPKFPSCPWCVVLKHGIGLPVHVVLPIQIQVLCWLWVC